MEKKKQHIIPNCYLKSWCDPTTPTGHQPAIWRIAKDGSARKRKSPEKSFTATDKYTIRLPNGERNLVVEDTLAGIEDAFVRILRQIESRETISERDHTNLCLFTAAMQTRTRAMGDHWRQFQQKIHAQVLALEKRRNAAPAKSLETKVMVENAHQLLIATGFNVVGPMLSFMPMTILISDDELGFITSDTPCVMFDPTAHRRPPISRSPGLGHENIEVTLPLTPHHLLFISHKRRPPYLNVNKDVTDELNRRTRFYCTEEFVSWKGKTRPFWFDLGREPEDAWEKTEEGKQSLAERDQMTQARETYQQSNRHKDTANSDGL